MANQHASDYERTVPMGSTANQLSRSKRNSSKRRLRIKPGWLVIAAVGVASASITSLDLSGAVAHANSAGAMVMSLDTPTEPRISPVHHASDPTTSATASPLATQNDDDLAGAVGIVHEQGPGTVQPPAEKTGAEAPVLEPQEPEPARPSRVLLVGIDGLRPDAIKRSKTPYLDALAKRGAFHLDGRAGDITLSGPGWASVLTGVDRKRHGIRNNRLKRLKTYRTWPTIFHRYKHQFPKRKTASVVGWKPINDKLLREAPLDISVKGGDASNADTTAEMLKQEQDLGMVFVHIDGVDTAGHRHGYHRSIAKYRQAIHHADRRFGRIMDALDTRADRDEWLVIVLTDHGGTRDGTHGASYLAHRRIFLMMEGATVTPGEMAKAPTLEDVAALIDEHLALPPYPATATEPLASNLTP